MNWSDDFRRFLHKQWGATPDAEALQEQYAWVTELHLKARELLAPAALRAFSPPEVYQRLLTLSVPRCPIRVANLGRENQASEIVEALVRLMETPGGFEAKFAAAKIRQTGVVTLTELLCVAKPVRFMLRNTRLTRAAARVIPLYTARGLNEIEYEDFLDLCRELARLLEETCSTVGLGDWAKTHRFLLLYAVLTGETSG